MSQETKTTLSPHDSDAGVPNYVRAVVHAEVKASNDEAREVLHLISTDSADRQGDVVEPGGADVSAFMKNPVVIADHDYRLEKILGRAKSVEIQDRGIWARTAFRDTELGRDAFALTKAGLGGWSIGFHPTEWESIRDGEKFKGYRFTKWELLEYSLVAIPANQDAINNAVQRGWVREEHVKHFFTSSPTLPRELTDAVVKAATTPAVDTQPDVSGLERVLTSMKRHDAAAEMELILHRRNKDG